MTVTEAKYLEGTPVPEAWADTEWFTRVHPDALQLWEVAIDGSCGGGSCAPPNGSFSALVQIDRFASAEAQITSSHFHDSYNNFGRFAASDLMFGPGHTVERCEDGAHVSYDIAGPFLEGSLGMRNISFIDNDFVTVSGCGDERAGTSGCAHVCTNMSCILAHVDPDLAKQVHASGNRVRLATDDTGAAGSLQGPRGGSHLKIDDTPLASCLSGTTIPHSNRSAPGSACIGTIGVECSYRCDDGFLAIGRHVCQTYSQGDSAYIDQAFFGGRCDRLCPATAAPCPAGQVPSRVNSSDATGPCLRTACSTPDAALRKL
eukprot:SAG11_NODE_4516_length_1866_cov_26.310130_1_plen_316_part_10